MVGYQNSLLIPLKSDQSITSGLCQADFDGQTRNKLHLLSWGHLHPLHLGGQGWDYSFETRTKVNSFTGYYHDWIGSLPKVSCEVILLLIYSSYSGMVLQPHLQLMVYQSRITAKASYYPLHIGAKTVTYSTFQADL